MMRSKKNILYFTIAIIILLTSWARSEVLQDLRGEAFSNPNIQLDMPDDWKQQPVKYDKWAGNVNLAITLDQHMYPALLPLIKKYARQNNLNIAVNEGTCGISAGLLVRKAVDIAGFCCPPGAKLKPLKIDGYGPSDYEHLLSGDYRIYYTYNLTAWTGAGAKKTLAADLIDYLLKHSDEIGPEFGVVPSSALRKSGWIFKGNELAGEPEIRHRRSR